MLRTLIYGHKARVLELCSLRTDPVPVSAVTKPLGWEQGDSREMLVALLWLKGCCLEVFRAFKEMKRCL